MGPALGFADLQRGTSPKTPFSEEGLRHALTLATQLEQRLAREKPSRLAAMLAGRLREMVDAALEVAVETGPPIGQALAERFAIEGDADLAERLARRLVEEPFSAAWPLHSLAILSIQKCLDLYGDSPARSGKGERSLFASLQYNLGRRLLALGRASEALVALEGALSLYRDLGSRMRSQQIASYGSCSEALTLLSRLPEALSRAREAVVLARAALGSIPAGRLAERSLSLAGHLINLGGCLADIGLHADALAAIDEAVALYRLHRHAVPGSFQAYARALLCRGNELHHLVRYAEAAESLEEAIQLSRELETSRSTAFEPDLALALGDLALFYEQSGQIEEARQALGEALDRFRRLESSYPESFRPSVAWSLSLVSPKLQGEETRDPSVDSVAARTEAVAHYRDLLASQAEAVEPLLAHCLFGLAESQLESGDLRPALANIQEAIKRQRRLDREPRDLGWSLLLRGRIRGELGHRRKSLADCREAVLLFRRRSSTQAAFHGVDLALGLHHWGIQMHHQGDFEGAIEVTREAVGLYRRLASGAPLALNEDLAACLQSLSHHLYEARRLEDSVLASRESADLYRALRGQHPRHAASLGAVLGNLAPRLSELGRDGDALAAASEAVELVRQVEGQEELRSAALHALGTVLLDLERPEEAMPHLEEAIELRERLAALQSHPHEVDLACSLVCLGKGLSAQERYAEALSRTRRAVRLLRTAVQRGEAFLRPRLAMTLSNQSHQLRKLGRARLALAAGRESIQLLAPFLEEDPKGYEAWILVALGNYLGAAEEANVEPDRESVAAIIAALARGSE